MICDLESKMRVLSIIQLGNVARKGFENVSKRVMGSSLCHYKEISMVIVP